MKPIQRTQFSGNMIVPYIPIIFAQKRNYSGILDIPEKSVILKIGRLSFISILIKLSCHMKAFICVYRHPVPSNADMVKTQKTAEKQPLLRKFLDDYSQPNCFYDWGDDPAFFSAKELLGDFRFATWGVCRRDVRNQLTKSDLVIYFCGRQRYNNLKIWDYYFIGFGTVSEAISRCLLWQDSRYYIYRDFFNVLAKFDGPALTQHEFFGKGHKDWCKRSSAPYIIFDQNEQNTDFNLTNPLHVATRLSDSPFEQWNSGKNELAKQIEESLFRNFNVERRLRTRNEQLAHRHISLHTYIDEHKRSESIQNLRSDLSKIAFRARAML